MGSSAGLLVSVDLKGNLERRLGRGHLRRALVALVLVPRTGSARPAVLATRGSGPAGETLRRTRNRDVLVTRDGDELLFSVLGGGLANVARVEVRTYTRAIVRGARRAQQPDFPEVFGQGAQLADGASVDAPDPDADPCETVRSMRMEKEQELERLQDEVELADAKLDDLDSDVEDAEEAFADEKSRDDPNEQRLEELDKRLEELEERRSNARETFERLRDARRTAARELLELLRVEEIVCAEGPTGTLEIFGQDHGVMGFGNVCVNASTNMTSGSATLTLDGPPGSVAPPAANTFQLDGSGDGSTIWRVFDPNATYTVSGSATGNLGSFNFQPLSLDFANVNAQGRACGPQ